MILLIYDKSYLLDASLPPMITNLKVLPGMSFADLIVYNDDVNITILKNKHGKCDILSKAEFTGYLLSLLDTHAFVV